MMADLVAACLLLSLTAYAILAGADFGGGIWDLLARGPQRDQQREAIAEAIGPIWEANHVWMILALVILFTCFPTAFSRLAIGLHIPLTLMLVGIVFRGSAFTFRSYDDRHDRVQQRWGRIFAVSSLITPLLLGVAVGAIASGGVRTPVTGAFWADYVAPWLSPFTLGVGLFTVVCFAYLAAVYLTLDTADPWLREDFRRRAIRSWVGVSVVGLLVFWLSSSAAPLIREGLTRSPWAAPLLITTAIAAGGGLLALVTRRYRAARVFAALEVSLILWGWGLAQYPYVLPPDLTIEAAAAPAITLELMLIGLAGGFVVLAPSMYYLFRVFKGRRPARSSH